MVELVARTGSSASATTPAEAAGAAAWVVFAVPYHAMGSILAEVGDLKNKIVIDIVNPLVLGDDAFEFYFRKGASPEISTGIRAAE